MQKVTKDEGKMFFSIILGCFLGLVFAAQSFAEKTGWPVEVKDNIFSSPALADIDGDGKLEVIVGSSGDNNNNNGSLYIWHCDGTPCPGWPLVVDGGVMYSTPAAGDLDPKFGGLEIAACTTTGKVYLWHKDGTPVEGWPKTLPTAIYSSPVIADLDHDGHPDIIIACTDGKVYVYNSSGVLLPGWPQDTGAQISSTSNPVVKDINGNGSLDVLVCNGNGRACLWDAKGQSISGWPREGFGNKTPAVGDLDPKYKGLEMVFSGKDELKILHTDGTSLAGWPKVVQTPGLSVIGDIDKDGLLEVVVSSDRGKETSPLICAWHADGKVVTGWPVDPKTAPGYSIGGAPVLKDLDGDGKLEIITGSTCYSIYAWNNDGTGVKNFPIGNIGMQYSSPAIADLDDNGRLEIVFGDVSRPVLKVHVFEMPFSYR